MKNKKNQLFLQVGLPLKKALRKTFVCMAKPVMKNYTPGCILVKLFTDICVEHAKFFIGRTSCRVEKGDEFGHIRGSFLKITLVKVKRTCKFETS